MSNFQFTLNSRKVLKNISNKAKAKIEKASLDAIDIIKDKLGTEYLEGGYSAFDYYRKYYYGKKSDRTKHHYNYWTVRNRSSSVSVNFEIRNRRPYVSSLYKNEFASSNHTGTMYWTKDKRHVTYNKPTSYNAEIATRKEQISKVRYLRIQRSMKSILTSKIRKVFKDAPSSTTSYKG